MRRLRSADQHVSRGLSELRPPSQKIEGLVRQYPDGDRRDYRRLGPTFVPWLALAATRQAKADRRMALTNEPTVIQKARGQGLGEP